MINDDPDREQLQALGKYELRLYEQLEQARKDGDIAAELKAKQLIDELHENF